VSGQYVCQSPGRAQALLDAAAATPPRLLNGIRYLEVGPTQRRLDVHFVHPLTLVPAMPLKPSNVEIRGGVRVANPAVTGVSANGHVLSVDVAAAGDFSPYTLRLVANAGVDAPPDGIDPALAEITFRFKVDCPSPFDCRPADTCEPPAATGPVIDYLARDYTSFRRLVLDRLAVLMPDWRERNPADLWVTLAEAVAFRADELSYFQDAVATEAYLGTARQRISVRRHTRLLDYPFHDGASARVWIAFEADASADGVTLAGCDPVTGLGGTQVLTRVPGLPPAIDSDSAGTALAAGAQPFELLAPVTLYTAHNAIRFFTWSDDECCLPQGATRAFLCDDVTNRMRLRAGDVLILEAKKSTATGEPADADALQRTAVRLTRVDPEAPVNSGIRGVPALRRDPITDQAFVEVHWGEDDALPFSLCLSKRIAGELVPDMAGACANVALADHGTTAPRADALTPLRGGRLPRYPLDRTAIAPLTQQLRVRIPGGDTAALIDASASAASAMVVDIADVRPAIDVRSEGDRRRWMARRDLLASDGEAAEFVVETRNDGLAVLRFGDGVNGRSPLAGDRLTARLRTGTGTAGNIGAEAIGHVVGHGIIGVRNPMAARGGLDPQPTSQARLYAPQAFRRQERAVTTEDYGTMMELEPRVQRAVATRRWTGSWYTVFITVDRRGASAVDSETETALRAFIERYRMAGHDVEIDAPIFVPLDVEMHVCVKPGYFAADVEQRLLDVLSAGRLPGGDSGFFHPDRLTFGQPVYLSAVIAATMAVPGVDYVTPLRFQRLGRPAAGEIVSGRIPIARLEIARLDNDPNAPEHGRLRLDVNTRG
jgi:hypothetical protein